MTDVALGAGGGIVAGEEASVIGPYQLDAAVVERIARRVEDILEAARERERRGQRLSLEIDARFQLVDLGAVQFQLAAAILEEAGGLDQEDVVTELLSLGLAVVLDGAARAAREVAVPGLESALMGESDPSQMREIRTVLDLPDLVSVPNTRIVH